MSTDRGEVKRLVEAAAFDVGKPCEHCGGDGKVPGGRQIVHCMSGPFGADWDVADVLAEIDGADSVEWIDTRGFGHDLVVIDRHGKVFSFQVKAPTDA